MHKPNTRIHGRFEATRRENKAGMGYGNKSLTYSGYTTGHAVYLSHSASGYSGYGPTGYSFYSVPWGREAIAVWESAFANQENREVSIKSDLSTGMVPFTQVDLLNYEKDQIQELIFRVRTSPSISCKELADRLLALFNDAEKEEANIATDSLRDFYSFFRLNSNLKCPTVSLTPEYNIYASWKPDQNRVFSIHFLSNGDARYVIFKPNDRHPERQIRVSGTATIDILKETVTPYGVWDWISVSGRTAIDILPETAASHGVWDRIAA